MGRRLPQFLGLLVLVAVVAVLATAPAGRSPRHARRSFAFTLLVSSRA